MIAERLYEKYEKATEYAVASLLIYMKEKSLEQVTPIYFIVNANAEVNFIDIKVGVKYPKK